MTPSVAVAANRTICVTRMTRRRSTMSASAPAKSPNSSDGAVLADLHQRHHQRRRRQRRHQPGGDGRLHRVAERRADGADVELPERRRAGAGTSEGPGRPARQCGSTRRKCSVAPKPRAGSHSVPTLSSPIPLVDRNAMKYRTLPGTDLDVSEVCLGTMTWGEQNSEEDAHAQLDYALAQGVNFIDTAEMYPVPPNAATQGRTETYLGSWLARRGRDGVVIATKVAGPGRRDWIRNGRTDLTRDVIAEAVDTSLARLANRLHRPLSDPLAAAQRADVRRAGVRSGEGARRAVDRRAGRRRSPGSSRPARSATTDCRTRRRGACASSGASRASRACRAR